MTTERTDTTAIRLVPRALPQGAIALTNARIVTLCGAASDEVQIAYSGVGAGRRPTCRTLAPSPQRVRVSAAAGQSGAREGGAGKGSPSSRECHTLFAQIVDAGADGRRLPPIHAPLRRTGAQSAAPFGLTGA